LKSLKVWGVSAFLATVPIAGRGGNLKLQPDAPDEACNFVADFPRSRNKLARRVLPGFRAL
jgi:hypothetical protein